MKRPGFINGLGLVPKHSRLGNSDPYNLDVCWSNFRPEAEKIVKGIRADIAKARQHYPGEADSVDRELISLLKKFRQKNSCPNLSMKGQHAYQNELQALVDRAKAAASRPPPAPLPPPPAPMPVPSPSRPSPSLGPGPVVKPAPVAQDYYEAPIIQDSSSGMGMYAIVGGVMLVGAAIGIYLLVK